MKTVMFTLGVCLAFCLLGAFPRTALAQDRDADGVADSADNCPDNANADQADHDGDGQGDVCDDDKDNDGLLNEDEENRWNTDPLDADTDDDAISDGEEVNVYGTDPTSYDSDGDKIPDGTELGFTDNTPDTNLAAGHFIPDADPREGSNTDPKNPDTDRGGLLDGEEDGDHNGWVGRKETDPNDMTDDLEMSGRRVNQCGLGQDRGVSASIGQIAAVWCLLGLFAIGYMLTRRRQPIR